MYDINEFAHPVFDKAAIRAQRALRAMQGQNRTWFVGAYLRHGFHEDGIASAMRVVRALNARHQLEGTEDAFDGQGAAIEIPLDLRTSA